MLLTDAVERIIVLIVQYKQNLSMGKGAVTMILVNTDYITGKELEMLGLVKGSTIQSKNIGRDISQGLKTLVGGELKAYNEMMRKQERWQRNA